MQPKIDFTYILISLILITIIIGHTMWYKDQNKRFIKIMIVLSVILFVIIFVHHAYFVYVHNKEKDITEADIYSLQSGIDNKAIHLLNNMIMHPIFHI
jgi:membrane protein YdbS with pleckstrin-like domain